MSNGKVTLEPAHFYTGIRGFTIEFHLKKGDEVKKIVSEILISKLIQYSYLLEQTKLLRLFCIIDEAHRMVYPGSPLDNLFRESRKYGIGVILASQRATDFNEILLSQSGSIMTFKQNLIKDARHIAKNRFAEDDVLMRARPGEGFIKFSNSQKPTHIQVTRGDSSE